MSSILNVRSVRDADGDQVADLTARARIRDAAIARFADDGFGVGLRAIAADAGVSVGLVAHHFGSKAGLREACDQYVLAILRDAKADTIDSDQAGATLLAQLAAVESYGPTAGYVLRTLQEGGAIARHFVDQVVADAEGYMSAGVASGTVVPSRDEEARTRYLVHQSLGALVLGFTLSKNPEESIQTWFNRYTAEIIGPALEVLTEGVLADSTMLDTYLAATSAEEHA